MDPKPVALSHRAVAAQVEILNGFWRDTEELRHSGVSWLPLYHDMGLIGCVFPALSRDATLTLIGPELFVARPALWLRALSPATGATISPAPNFAYSLCVTRVSDAEMEGVDLSGWRTALNGAGPVAPGAARLLRALRRWGFRPEALTPVYGLSEAALAVTFSDLDRPFRAARFDREGLPGGLAREAGRPRDRFRGPARARASGCGSRTRPGRAAREAGWAGCGSRGRRSWRAISAIPRPRRARCGTAGSTRATSGFLPEGELFLTGRAKDVVILRGRNYAPEEIERAVDGIPGCGGCVVAASWLPEDAAGRGAGPLRRDVAEGPPAEIEALPESLPESGARRHRARGGRGRRAGAGNAPPDLLRQAPPAGDPAALPRRRAAPPEP